MTAKMGIDIMRLTDEQIDIIKYTVAGVFGPHAKPRLFGSRVDDGARGGDIDLLIECSDIVDEKLQKKLTLTARLQMRLGDQPIDLLIIDPMVALKPIHRHALRSGEVL